MRLTLPFCLLVPLAVDVSAALEEVIVTARKVEETIQEVPVAVSAFSGENLRQQSIQEFVDLSAQLPSVEIESVSQDPNQVGITIRGQSRSDTLLTVDAAVGVYLDGINMPRVTGLNANLFDIERVEVLKGPQGTLYGRNNTGGAVNVISRKPDFDGVHGFLDATAGNESFLQVGGAINIPLSDTVAARFAIQKTDQDGFGEQLVTGDDLYDQDELFVRGSLTIDVSDNLNVLVQTDYLDYDEGGAIHRLIYPGGDITNPNDPVSFFPSIVVGVETGALNPLDLPTALGGMGGDFGGPTFFPGVLAGFSALTDALDTGGNFQDTNGDFPLFSTGETYGGGITVSYDISDSLQFKSVTGYRNWKNSRALDLDGTPYALLHVIQEVDADFFSQELQLSGVSDSFNWVTGAYYSVEEGTDGGITAAVAALNPTLTIVDGDVKNSSWGIFAQGNWSLSDQLNLTVGARWTEEEKELDSHNRLELAALPGVLFVCNVPSVDIPGECSGETSDDFNDPSWLASLDYKLNDDVLVYGSVARSWRGGGQNLRADDGPSATPVAQETATTYELGLKGDFLDSTLRINAAAYFTDYEDIQRSVIVPTSTGGTTTVLTNAAAADITGFEIEAWYYATQNLSFLLTASHIDFEYQEFDSFAQDGVTIIDRSDEEIDTPKNTFSISAIYEQDVAGNPFRAQVDYSWRDEINHNATSLTPELATEDAYGLVNARLSYEITDMDLSISLWGKNLLDEDETVEILDLTGNIGFSSGVSGKPRTFGLTISKKFGAE